MKTKLLSKLRKIADKYINLRRQGSGWCIYVNYIPPKFTSFSPGDELKKTTSCYYVEPYSKTNYVMYTLHNDNEKNSYKKLQSYLEVIKRRYILQTVYHLRKR